MMEMAPLDAYKFAVSAATALVLAYLLYSGRFVVHYRRFFQTITAGLLLAVATGALAVVLSPGVLHAVHGLAFLFVSAGLYLVVRDELRGEFRIFEDADDAFGFEEFE